jgi:hypothetical protein
MDDKTSGICGKKEKKRNAYRLLVEKPEGKTQAKMEG